MKVKILELKEIGYNIHLIKGSWKQTRKYLKKHYGEHLDEFETAEGFCANKGLSSYIFVKNPDINVCIHEIVHAIQKFFQTINYIDFNEGLSEPLAYYIAYYSEECIKFYLPKLGKPTKLK